MAAVLIVEDEAAILMLAESVIQDAGYDTLSAASLPEARDIIESGARFDLVFTDINLRDVSDGGIRIGEMIAQLKPDVPVLYTSACELNAGLRSRLQGPPEFIPKPYRCDDAIARIERLLHV
jgi:CheY-like chemotaxis protein